MPTEPLVLSGVPDGVQAQASLINHTWGTEVLLDVRDLPPGEVFAVALDGRDGSRATPARSSPSRTS